MRTGERQRCAAGHRLDEVGLDAGVRLAVPGVLGRKLALGVPMLGRVGRVGPRVVAEHCAAGPDGQLFPGDRADHMSVRYLMDRYRPARAAAGRPT